MSEDEERRSNRNKSSRRDAARSGQRAAALIEGETVDPAGAAVPEDVLSEAADESASFKDPVPTASFAPEDAIDPAGSATTSPDFLTSPSTLQDDGPTMSDTVPSGPEPATNRSPYATTPPSDAGDGSRSALPLILAAAVVILAVAVIYLFYQLSSLGPDLSPEVAGLKTQVAALDARPPVDAAAITKRLDGADAALAAVKGSITTLGKRVDALGTPATATPPAPAAPDLSPRLAALDTQLADLKRDLTALRATVANLPKPDFGPVESRIGDVDRKVSALQTVVGAIPRIDLGPLTAKVDALDTRLKPVEAEVEASKSPQRVAERQAAPVAVTAQAVLGAIGSARPFEKDFKALQGLGVDPAKLAPLQAVSDTGAPSLADLQADLSRLRDRIISQGAPPAAGSYMDRLMAGAGTLVQVRPLGSVAGDTPAAIVARINADLGDDALEAALAEWKKLPEASQTVSKALAERITLRLNAENAAKSIAADAITTMAAPKG